MFVLEVGKAAVLKTWRGQEYLLSLDEVYLDVTENLRGIPTAFATAKDIRARILIETGLTASAGISYNKFLAKLASDHASLTVSLSSRPRWGLASSKNCRSANFTASARLRPTR